MTFDELVSIVEAKVFRTYDFKRKRYVYSEDQPPLKDDDVIRVYHGFNRLDDAVECLTHGISGKQRAKRIYSYESNNNPKGLFVTIKFDVAKKFGNYIIEFHTKVSDLEAPVWPTGSYTSQGQMASYFNDEDHREEQRLKDREQASKHFGTSDCPELAERLFDNPENQALFIGDLDANSVRAIWENSTPEKAGRFSDYIRTSPKEFLKKYKEYINKRNTRVFRPRDEFDLNTFLTRLHTDSPQDENPEKSKQSLLNILQGFEDYQLLHYIWPKQLSKAKRDIQNAIH